MGKEDDDDDGTRQQAVNLLALKQRILSTDLLIRQYAAKCQEFDAIARQLDDKRRQADKADKECSSLEKQLRSALEEMQPLRKSHDELQSANKKLSAANESLRVQLASAEATAAQYVVAVKAKDVELTELESAKTDLQQRVRTLEDKQKKQDKELSKTKASLASVNEDLRAARAEVTQLKKQLKKLEGNSKKTKQKPAACAFDEHDSGRDSLLDLQHEEAPPCALSLDDILRDMDVASLVSPLHHGSSPETVVDDGCEVLSDCSSLVLGDELGVADGDFDWSLDEIARTVEMQLSDPEEADSAQLRSPPDRTTVADSCLAGSVPQPMSLPAAEASCVIAQQGIATELPFASFRTHEPIVAKDCGVIEPPPLQAQLQVEGGNSADPSGDCVSRRLELARQERLQRRARAKGALSTSDVGLCVRRSDRNRPQAPLTRHSAVDAEDERTDCGMLDAREAGSVTISADDDEDGERGKDDCSKVVKGDMPKQESLGFELVQASTVPSYLCDDSRDCVELPSKESSEAVLRHAAASGCVCASQEGSPLPPRSGMNVAAEGTTPASICSTSVIDDSVVCAAFAAAEDPQSRAPALPQSLGKPDQADTYTLSSVPLADAVQCHESAASIAVPASLAVHDGDSPLEPRLVPGTLHGPKMVRRLSEDTLNLLPCADVAGRNQVKAEGTSVISDIHRQGDSAVALLSGTLGGCLDLRPPDTLAVCPTASVAVTADPAALVGQNVNDSGHMVQPGAEPPGDCSREANVSATLSSSSTSVEAGEISGPSDGAHIDRIEEKPLIAASIGARGHEGPASETASAEHSNTVLPANAISVTQSAGHVSVSPVRLVPLRSETLERGSSPGAQVDDANKFGATAEFDAAAAAPVGSIQPQEIGVAWSQENGNGKTRSASFTTEACAVAVKEAAVLRVAQAAASVTMAHTAQRQDSGGFVHTAKSPVSEHPAPCAVPARAEVSEFGAAVALSAADRADTDIVPFPLDKQSDSAAALPDTSIVASSSGVANRESTHRVSELTSVSNAVNGVSDTVDISGTPGTLKALGTSGDSCLSAELDSPGKPASADPSEAARRALQRRRVWVLPQQQGAGSRPGAGTCAAPPGPADQLKTGTERLGHPSQPVAQALVGSATGVETIESSGKPAFSYTASSRPLSARMQRRRLKNLAKLREKFGANFNADRGHTSSPAAEGTVAEHGVHLPAHPLAPSMPAEPKAIAGPSGHSCMTAAQPRVSGAGVAAMAQLPAARSCAAGAQPPASSSCAAGVQPHTFLSSPVSSDFVSPTVLARRHSEAEQIVTEHMATLSSPVARALVGPSETEVSSLPPLFHAIHTRGASVPSLFSALLTPGAAGGPQTTRSSTSAAEPVAEPLSAGDEVPPLSPINAVDIRALIDIVNRLSPLPCSPVRRHCGGSISAASSSAAFGGRSLEDGQSGMPAPQTRIKRCLEDAAADSRSIELCSNRARQNIESNDAEEPPSSCDSAAPGTAKRHLWPVKRKTRSDAKEKLARDSEPSVRGAKTLKSVSFVPARDQEGSRDVVSDPVPGVEGKGTCEAAMGPVLQGKPTSPLLFGVLPTSTADLQFKDVKQSGLNEELAVDSEGAGSQSQRPPAKKRRKVFTDDRAARMTGTGAALDPRGRMVSEGRKLLSYATADDPFADLVISAADAPVGEKPLRARSADSHCALHQQRLPEGSSGCAALAMDPDPSLPSCPPSTSPAAAETKAAEHASSLDSVSSALSAASLGNKDNNMDSCNSENLSPRPALVDDSVGKILASADVVQRRAGSKENEEKDKGISEVPGDVTGPDVALVPCVRPLALSVVGAFTDQQPGTTFPTGKVEVDAAPAAAQECADTTFAFTARTSANTESRSAVCAGAQAASAGQGASASSLTSGALGTASAAAETGDDSCAAGWDTETVEAERNGTAAVDTVAVRTAKDEICTAAVDAAAVRTGTDCDGCTDAVDTATTDNAKAEATAADTESDGSVRSAADFSPPNQPAAGDMLATRVTADDIAVVTVVESVEISCRAPGCDRTPRSGTAADVAATATVPCFTLPVDVTTVCRLVSPSDAIVAPPSGVVSSIVAAHVGTIQSCKAECACDTSDTRTCGACLPLRGHVGVVPAVFDCVAASCDGTSATQAMSESSPDDSLSIHALGTSVTCNAVRVPDLPTAVAAAVWPDLIGPSDLASNAKQHEQVVSTDLMTSNELAGKLLVRDEAGTRPLSVSSSSSLALSLASESESYDTMRSGPTADSSAASMAVSVMPMITDIDARQRALDVSLLGKDEHQQLTQKLDCTEDVCDSDGELVIDEGEAAVVPGDKGHQCQDMPSSHMYPRHRVDESTALPRPVCGLNAGADASANEKSALPLLAICEPRKKTDAVAVPIPVGSLLRKDSGWTLSDDASTSPSMNVCIAVPMLSCASPVKQAMAGSKVTATHVLLPSPLANTAKKETLEEENGAGALPSSPASCAADIRAFIDIVSRLSPLPCSPVSRCISHSEATLDDAACGRGSAAGDWERERVLRSRSEQPAAQRGAAGSKQKLTYGSENPALLPCTFREVAMVPVGKGAGQLANPVRASIAADCYGSCSSSQDVITARSPSSSAGGLADGALQKETPVLLGVLVQSGGDTQCEKRVFDDTRDAEGKQRKSRPPARKKRKMFSDDQASRMTGAADPRREPVGTGRELVSYADVDDPFVNAAVEGPYESTVVKECGDSVAEKDCTTPIAEEGRCVRGQGHGPRASGKGRAADVPTTTMCAGDGLGQPSYINAKAANVAQPKPKNSASAGSAKQHAKPAAAPSAGQGKAGAKKGKKKKKKKKTKTQQLPAAAAAAVVNVPKVFELPYENQLKYADSELRRYLQNETGMAVKDFADGLMKVIKRPNALLDSMIKVITKSQDDMVVDLSSRCEAGTFCPPLHTQGESKIITLLHFAAQKLTGMGDLYCCAAEAFAKAVVDGSNPETTVLGKSSLCRLFATLCKAKGSRARVRSLVCDVLSSGQPAFPALVVAIASCWPEVLQSSGQEDMQCQAYEHFVMRRLSADMRKHVMFKQMLNILQKLCRWSPNLPSPGPLCLGIVTQVLKTTSFAERDNLLRHLKLLALCEPWPWVKVELITCAIWPQLQGWATSVVRVGQKLPRSSSLNDDIVCDLLDLIGVLCQRCPPKTRDAGTFVPDVMSTLLEILSYSTPAAQGSGGGKQSMVRADVSWDVQMSTMKVLLLLAPYSPTITAQACQSWVNPNYSRIEHRVMADVQRFWHAYGSSRF